MLYTSLSFGLKTLKFIFLLLFVFALHGCVATNGSDATNGPGVTDDTRFAIIRSDDWAWPPFPTVESSSMSGQSRHSGFMYLVNKHSVPAVLGLVGMFTEQSAEFYKYVLAQGHELANHTYAHSDYPLLNEQQTITDINASHNAIMEYVCTGSSANCAPITFIPAFNKLNEFAIEQMVDIGYQYTFESSRFKVSYSGIKVLPVGCPGVYEGRHIDGSFIFTFSPELYKRSGHVPLCAPVTHPHEWDAADFQQFEKMLVFFKQEGIRVVTARQFFEQAQNPDAYIARSREIIQQYVAPESIQLESLSHSHSVHH